MLKKSFKAFLILALIFSLSSCSTLLNNLSDSLYRQNDLKLVEDGAPSYLLLVEAFVTPKTTDRNMLSTAIQLYSAYSQAFVKDPKRQRLFTDKTKNWALQLLRTYPKFKAVETKEFSEYEKWTGSIGKRDVPYVFWAANAWIFWIIANLDSVDAVIDLPKAKAIIDRIMVLDSSYYYGAPHLFYGMFYSLMPEMVGGSLTKAKVEFDSALKYSGDKFLMTKVSYAQFYLKAKNDKKGFIKTLNEVLETDMDKYPEMRLLNLFAKNQAEELLKKTNELFIDL
jgi:hypothetical protein